MVKCFFSPGILGGFVRIGSGSAAAAVCSGGHIPWEMQFYFVPKPNLLLPQKRKSVDGLICELVKNSICLFEHRRGLFVNAHIKRLVLYLLRQSRRLAFAPK